MPKYKDSPEVRAAKKERKEKLREFLQYFFFFHLFSSNICIIICLF